MVFNLASLAFADENACLRGCANDASVNDFAGGLTIRYCSHLWRDHEQGRRHCVRLVQRGRSRARHLFLSQEHGAARPELRWSVPRDMINCGLEFAEVLSIPEQETDAGVASCTPQH